jgi:ABC-type multidrug transport system fused ATPase/permease subunit
MTALIGACGSGKTSLLSALMGDLDLTKGTLTLGEGLWDRLGLMPQRAFVLSGTLKENILIGRPFDSGRYEQTLTAAQLFDDLRSAGGGHGAGERVSLQDDTQLGERGVTLSGGQQQRLGIARALYGDPDILLIDDALSAVDAQVARSIFKEVCKLTGKEAADDAPAARKRTVIMVLNQLHLLPHFDRVVYLKHGQIVADGSHHDLLSTNADYAEFVSSQPLSSPDELATVSAPVPAAPVLAAAPDLASTEDAYASEPMTPETKTRNMEDVAEEQDTPSSLITDEHKESGSMRSSVSIQFVRAMGVAYFSFCMFLCAAAHALIGVSDRWLALWVESEEDDCPNDSPHNLSSVLTPAPDRTHYYAAVYASINSAHLLGLFLSSYCICEGIFRAGKRLHHDTLSHLLRAPVSWYEATPSGRITSRFSMDLSQVDLMLGFMVDNMSSFIFSILVLVGVVVYLVPPLAAAVLIGIVVYAMLVVAADRTNREVKRMANNAMSPVLSTMTEAVEGRLLLRQMGFTEVIMQRQAVHVDSFNSKNFFSATSITWGMLVAQLLSGVFSFGVAGCVVCLPGYSPSDAGLGLLYSFMIPYFLAFLSFQISTTKSTLYSLERLFEFKSQRVPQEPAWHLPHDNTLQHRKQPAASEPTSAWPTNGKVVFQDVELRYRPGLPPALRGLTLQIPGGTRVGICGRTGAGKSSLFALLFRVLAPSSGRVWIDGQAIDAVGLMMLRRGMAIIPQSPLLLPGTVKENLDPFGLHSSEQLTFALVRVGLPATMLSASVGKGGSTLSAGECQLIAFARTSLQNVKIVCLDEPTANLDSESDRKVQNVVRSVFRDATVLTVAHRLHTIMDSELIVVLDHGTVAESGTPQELAQRPESHLAQMLGAHGAAGAVGSN